MKTLQESTPTSLTAPTVNKGLKRERNKTEVDAQLNQTGVIPSEKY